MGDRETVVIGPGDVGTVVGIEPTRRVFCAQCQVETAHKFVVARNMNGHVELIATCHCGRTIKFPEGLTLEQLRAAIAQQKIDNLGHVPAAADTIPADHPLLKALEQL